MGATIRISPIAWMKMQTLVMGYDKEVGWFGTCEQVGHLEYRIKDILVFPQYTSGCFVDDERDDPLEFRKWLDTLDDETYNSRRLWGHSHVNMATYPSGTDTDMFKRFAQTSCAALENKFAICVIMNKRCDMYWWVYDGETDKAYVKNDVNVMIEVEYGKTNLEYFEETKTLVRDIRPTTAFLFNKGTYSSQGGGAFGANHEVATGYNYGGYNTYVQNRNQKNNNYNKKDDKNDVVSTNGTSKASNDVSEDYGYYGEEWISEYYKSLYGEDDDDNYDDIGSVSGRAYDIEVKSDSVEVTEVLNERIFDYKNDVIIEDEIGGNIYRLIVTDDELIPGHPVTNDCVLMRLVEGIIEENVSFFSVWEDSEDGEHITAVIPDNEDEIMDMILAPAENVEFDNGVISVYIANQKKEVRNKEGA